MQNEFDIIDLSPDALFTGAEKTKVEMTNALMAACGEGLYAISLDAPGLTVHLDVDNNQWAIITGEENSEFNMAWVGQGSDTHDTAQNVEAMISFLNSFKVPTLLFLPENSSFVLDIAKNLGAEYLDEESVPLMHLNIGDLTITEELSDVDIEQLRGEDIEKLYSVINIQANALGFELDTVKRTFGQDVLKHEAVSIYLAKVEDNYVSTVTVVRHGDTVSIWNMGTLSDDQKRGYGRALLQRVIHDEKKQGIKHCILLATAVGKKLYDKMGFKTVSNLKMCVIGDNLEE